MYVLTSARTFSGGEGVAYDLQALELATIVELGRKAPRQRCTKIRQARANPRDERKRLGQRRDVARARGAERYARDETFEVVKAAKRIAQAGALGHSKRKVFDRVEPILNASQRHEGTHEPLAQQSSTHRRDGTVHFVEQ